MALVPEDGSGFEDANSYVSLVYADTFHLDRLNTKWAAATTGERVAALIKATEYIDKRFGAQFRGQKQNHFQSLEWPRLGAYDDSDFWLQDVPARLQRATAEYALRALIYIVLAPDPIRPVPGQSFELTGTSVTTTPTTGSRILAQETEVGSIRKSVKYADAATNKLTANLRDVQNGIVNDFNIPEYPEADMWLKGLLRSTLTTDMVRG